jgi:Uma2 family endonuclease
MSLHRKAFPTEIDYPETDGKPMAETDVHRDLMKELIDELSDFFQHEPDVYVSGNLLVYYEEGNPRKNVSPDIFVVRGVGKHRRHVYKLWEEGRAPDVVIEISSRKTWAEDLHKKLQLYARLGVREYFVFDPEYDYLDQPLLAFRSEDGILEPVAVTDGCARSEALGLELIDTGTTLRLRDVQTGLLLPIRSEIEAALRQAEIARIEAEAAREQAEAAREQAEARAQAEAVARAQAEAELARVREELARLRQPS